MKIQKKQLSAVIAFALMLTLAATFITALPVTLGQTQILITTYIWPWVGRTTVGINQPMLIEGVLYPPPGYTINHTYTIRAPNGTITKKNVATFDPIGGVESYFYF